MANATLPGTDDQQTIATMETQFNSPEAARLNALLAGTGDRQATTAMEAQLQFTDTAKLNALIDRIKAGLRRVNNRRTLSDNPELARLATNYGSLLIQANTLLDKVDNASDLEALSTQVSQLEGFLDKCLHENQTIDAGPLAATVQTNNGIMPPDQFWLQYFGTIAMMTNEVQLLHHQNREIQNDLRTIHWGHKHFHQTLLMASMLNAPGEPPELKSAKLEKILSDTQAEMEAEVHEEELAMLSEGATAEEIAEHHARFRAFIGHRVGHMRVSAHAIAEKMQLSYGHAKPVIERMYHDYLAHPYENLRHHYPVYQQNVSTFMHKHAASTRHLSGNLWTSGTTGVHTLATELGTQLGRLHGVIENAKDVNMVITQTDALGMDQTLDTLLQQNYADGCSLAQNLRELKEQEQLISDLLSGKKNDAESVMKAAAFLGMENNAGVVLKQVNAYRGAHQIPEMKVSWLEKMRVFNAPDMSPPAP